jgi:hypothetical protein
MPRARQINARPWPCLIQHLFGWTVRLFVKGYSALPCLCAAWKFNREIGHTSAAIRTDKDNFLCSK